MTAVETVARYHRAWESRRGDMTDVPLAEDFHFSGPVASFEARRRFVRWRGRPGRQ